MRTSRIAGTSAGRRKIEPEALASRSRSHNSRARAVSGEAAGTQGGTGEPVKRQRIDGDQPACPVVRAANTSALKALTHLDHAAEGDVIVHDRGYWSFEMALVHNLRKLHFVFRIQNNANPVFDTFIASEQGDRIITLKAPRDATELRGRSLRIRLVKYTHADTEYYLATSLHDSRYTVQALSDLYHGRWQVEEGYKTGKDVIESFHAKSERGVRQELYAAFTLVALARLFSNRCGRDINHNAGDDDDQRPCAPTSGTE